jgi:dihydropteroate synthase
MMLWRCRNHVLDLTRRTAVMGIVNVTPDSFSDGGRFATAEAAVRHGLALAEEGADILDVGGESTRPGSEPVARDEELRRVISVIEGLRAQSALPISIDTTKAEVARRSLEAGADIINDVTALRGDPAMARVAADSGAGVVLMHMLGAPRTMQLDPRYDDVVAEVGVFLRERLEAAVAAGIEAERIALDPGIGFGKTLEHNMEILRRLGELTPLGRPILVGPSRKAFIGAILDLPVAERVEGTAAAVVAAVLAGARVVRVHDVRAMVRAARVAESIRG